MEKLFHLCPSHFPPQRVGGEFHAAEGEPFLAQVLQRGADMIHRVVNAVCSKMELTESPFRLGDSGSARYDGKGQG